MNFSYAMMELEATEALDAKLLLFRAAQENWEASRGKFGEKEALALGKKIQTEYEAMKNAYALIGLTDLGIHNVKVEK